MLNNIGKNLVCRQADQSAGIKIGKVNHIYLNVDALSTNSHKLSTNLIRRYQLVILL